jgi:hypothetical protein
MRQLTTIQGSGIPGTNRVFKLNWASGGGGGASVGATTERRLVVILPSFIHFEFHICRDVGTGDFSIFVGDLSAEVNDAMLLVIFCFGNL